MRTVSCYGYTTHAHISFDVSTRSIDGCTLLLRLWTPGITQYMGGVAFEVLHTFVHVLCLVQEALLKDYEHK